MKQIEFSRVIFFLFVVRVVSEEFNNVTQLFIKGADDAKAEKRASQKDHDTAHDPKSFLVVMDLHLKNDGDPRAGVYDKLIEEMKSVFFFSIECNFKYYELCYNTK